MQDKNPIFYPLKTSEGFYKSKNSKFLSFLFPFRSITEIERELKKLQKKYYDATHICYAWRLGFDKPTFRANDSGEPTYSAGMPIYRKIVSYEISDVLIAVVRYFGGTKLGVSGLIEAYETAAELAIQHTKLEKYIPKLNLKVKVPISQLHLFYQVIESFSYELTSQEFNENEVVLDAEILKEEYVQIIKEFQRIGINLEKF